MPISKSISFSYIKSQLIVGFGLSACATRSGAAKTQQTNIVMAQMAHRFFFNIVSLLVGNIPIYLCKATQNKCNHNHKYPHQISVGNIYEWLYFHWCHQLTHNVSIFVMVCFQFEIPITLHFF